VNKVLFYYTLFCRVILIKISITLIISSFSKQLDINSLSLSVPSIIFILIVAGINCFYFYPFVLANLAAGISKVATIFNYLMEGIEIGLSIIIIRERGIRYTGLFDLTDPSGSKLRNFYWFNMGHFEIKHVNLNNNIICVLVPLTRNILTPLEAYGVRQTAMRYVIMNNPTHSCFRNTVRIPYSVY
jgi:hypothetical protein